MHRDAQRDVLVAGATGFVGRALIPALVAAGYPVRSMSRRHGGAEGPGVRWVAADLDRPDTLRPAVERVWAAYYLVHSIGEGGYRERERLAARAFAHAAATAGVSRIVYLGGVAPKSRPSEHLASRLEVGEILRNGPVPTLELRASMIIGRDSASWQIVRDLALRLPAMILPSWLRTRTRPIAIEDATRALVDGLRVSLPESTWYDIPGPEELSAQEILMRVAALRGRRIPAIETPLPNPLISSLWLRLVTRVDFELAKDLVLGLADDLLPRDERYWELCGRWPCIGFDAAARRALDLDEPGPGLKGLIATIEESLVDRLSPRLRACDRLRRPDVQ